MNTGILKAEGIHKSYGKNEVLRDLDLEIHPGKIYGLIGRNGAGKTTLLGILTAQNTADRGSVTLDGQAVWENQAALDQLCFSRELQATLFSGQNSLKVKHYLNSAAIYYSRWDQPYADRLLAEFRLEPNKKIFQLSKGQMSMVTILIALASRAPITILDEPAAGLDPGGRREILGGVKKYARESGTNVIIVSHSMEDMAMYCDDLVVMSSGKVLMHDTCAAVFSRAEELIEVGLDVPQITRVAYALQKYGVDIGRDVYTVDWAFDKLRNGK